MQHKDIPRLRREVWRGEAVADYLVVERTSRQNYVPIRKVAVTSNYLEKNGSFCAAV
jgi:hypothetical protein